MNSEAHLRLIGEAKRVAIDLRASDICHVGGVGAALVTGDGRLFTGVSVDCACGIGTCAEHSAIVEMAKTGATRIAHIVAVGSDGKILMPCGRCRELMFQVNHANLDADVVVDDSTSCKLSTLLPRPWYSPAS